MIYPLYSVLSCTSSRIIRSLREWRTSMIFTEPLPNDCRTGWNAYYFLDFQSLCVRRWLGVRDKRCYVYKTHMILMVFYFFYRAGIYCMIYTDFFLPTSLYAIISWYNSLRWTSITWLYGRRTVGISKSHRLISAIHQTKDEACNFQRNPCVVCVLNKNNKYHTLYRKAFKYSAHSWT